MRNLLLACLLLLLLIRRRPVAPEIGIGRYRNFHPATLHDYVNMKGKVN